jgi:hypothetical protein
MKNETVVPTFFGKPLVLTPSQLCVSAEYNHIEAYYDGEEMQRVRLFHVEPLIGWYVAEQWDGKFYTIAGNADVLCDSLAEAVAWLANEGGAEEFAYALERAAL